MRVRVSCDASAGSLRFLLRVPHDLELVADFVRHLHLPPAAEGDFAGLEGRWFRLASNASPGRRLARR